jgi:hypothetical protein
MSVKICLPMVHKILGESVNYGGRLGPCQVWGAGERAAGISPRFCRERNER